MVNHIWIDFDLGNCGLRRGAGVRLAVAVWGEYNTIHSHTRTPYAEAGTHKLLIREIRAEKTLHRDTIRRWGSCGEHI